MIVEGGFFEGRRRFPVFFLCRSRRSAFHYLVEPVGQLGTHSVMSPVSTGPATGGSALYHGQDASHVLEPRCHPQLLTLPARPFIEISHHSLSFSHDLTLAS